MCKNRVFNSICKTRTSYATSPASVKRESRTSRSWNCPKDNTRSCPVPRERQILPNSDLNMSTVRLSFITHDGQSLMQTCQRQGNEFRIVITWLKTAASQLSVWILIPTPTTNASARHQRRLRTLVIFSPPLHLLWKQQLQSSLWRAFYLKKKSVTSSRLQQATGKDLTISGNLVPKMMVRY